MVIRKHDQRIFFFTIMEVTSLLFCFCIFIGVLHGHGFCCIVCVGRMGRKSKDMVNTMKQYTVAFQIS